MNQPAPKTSYLKDYTPPDYLIETVDLRFDLQVEETIVQSRLQVVRNPLRDAHHTPLVLNGRELVLRSLTLGGETLAPERYQVEEEQLTIYQVPERFTLEVETQIRPHENTSLEGLYQSQGNFCTQCEAEGFRKITYFLDRPDILARYTTTIIADRQRYPVLLSNGNPIARGLTPEQRHWVTWQDPFPKPCYLFALVAGDLACVEDQFTTCSGRMVKLQLFVERHNLDKCDHAMQSLKKAMRWDEEVFGLEYDLDIYMIVAVDDFNMGAMENKGLNIFNAKYVLAKPETATDADYAAIEGVIGHEYFHNWTGNRVTCRDWFQLSLKEGLTVFRDQMFSAAMSAGPVKRIRDVRVLREQQFPEDAGPMAHPVRPESYIEISNFYTPTVYNKGAEVIRMLHTLLGDTGFRRGLTRYLSRHDGQAATTDDFVRAMEDASGMELAQFRLWYSQAGTPVVEIKGTYDRDAKSYTLALKQSCPPTPGQLHKVPLHIPLALALLGSRGQELPLWVEGEAGAAVATEKVLSMTQEQQSITFTDVPKEPVPSLLRGFSAPVKLLAERSDDQLAFLLGHDTDSFNRWDAGQELASRLMLRLIDDQRSGRLRQLSTAFIEAVGTVLADPVLDRALVAELLTLPSETHMANQMDIIDVDAIHGTRQFVRRSLGQELKQRLLSAYHANHDRGLYHHHPLSAGRRNLKNVCLGYLMALDEPEVRALCVAQFDRANNMTDALGALAWLANTECPERHDMLARFEQRWRNDTLVMDKWFTIQAGSCLATSLEEVKALMTHPTFDLKNPNKVRALIGTFCHHNPVQFHRQDGEGYRFLADCVCQLDPLNPQVSARLLGAFSRWRRFDPHRQRLMCSELERVSQLPRLSRDSYEIVSKTLA